MLELMFPGRIDLGLARARERDLVSAALLDTRLANFERDEFERKTKETLAWLGWGLDDPALRAVPRGVESSAQVSLLGSSASSAPFAANAAGCFAFSRLINVDRTETGATFERYREQFVPAHGLRSPIRHSWLAVPAPSRNKTRAPHYRRSRPLRRSSALPISVAMSCSR